MDADAIDPSSQKRLRYSSLWEWKRLLCNRTLHPRNVFKVRRVPLDLPASRAYTFELIERPTAHPSDLTPLGEKHGDRCEIPSLNIFAGNTS